MTHLKINSELCKVYFATEILNDKSTAIKTIYTSFRNLLKYKTLEGRVIVTECVKYATFITKIET